MKKFTEFNFQMHTEIVFGKGAEKETAALIRKYGGSKVMIVFGGGSIKKSGVFDSVAGELNSAGLPYIELGGVQPNPRRSFVDKGLMTAQEEKVDFILAIGGGSAIDTAKSIALGLIYDGNYWQFYTGTEPLKLAPIGAIPTISAAGSETSGSAVLVDDIKLMENSDSYTPRRARCSQL